MTDATTMDALRAQNIALQVQLAGQERELAQCRHALKLALTKAGSWGTVRNRVVLSKSLNAVPPKAWPAVAEDTAAESEQAHALIESLRARLNDAVAQREEAAGRARNAEGKLAQAEAASKASQVSVTAAQSAEATKPSTAIVAHLMAQIKFLHEEVERLETVATEARERGAQEAEDATRRFVKDIVAKDRELERLRLEVVRARSAGTRNSPQPSMTSGGASQASYDELSALLQDAVEAKHTLLQEKTALQAKLRKLDATLAAQKHAIADLKDDKERSGDLHAFKAKDLTGALATLTAERNALQEELAAHRRRANTAHYNVDVQCDVTPHVQRYCQTDVPEPRTQSAECQVDTATTPLKVLDEGEHGYSVPALAHALEVKCGELDACRAKLEELHEGSAFSAERMKGLQDALQDEAGRRRAAEGECERLGIQVRALQQHASQLQVHVRDAVAAAKQADARTQDALTASLRAEQERQVWQEQIASQAKDMDHLVAQHNLAHSQLAAAAAECDGLRDELQKALHREAQLQYEIKAKHAELAELMGAYQQCAREAEVLHGNAEALAQECDNLRGLLAMRDERVLSMSDQIRDLHEREQQHLMDLQAVDYENGVLHRKLVASENAYAQVHAQAAETMHMLKASEKIISDFERNHAELHKHLVVKENELMLLRQSVDDVTRQHAAASHAQQNAARRVAELEDANARMAVRGLMTQVAQQTAEASAEDVLNRLHESNNKLTAANADLKRKLDDTNAALDRATTALRGHNELTETLRGQIADLTEQRDALATAQDRLEALVRSQAETLAGIDD
jgi:chromosome segregation ATPase